MSKLDKIQSVSIVVMFLALCSGLYFIARGEKISQGQLLGNNEGGSVGEINSTVRNDQNQVNMTSNLANPVLPSLVETEKSAQQTSNNDLFVSNSSEPNSASIIETSRGPNDKTNTLNQLISRRGKNKSEKVVLLDPASDLEMVVEETVGRNDSVPFLSMTKTNDVYKGMYEHDIGIQRQEYTLSSSIGEMLADNPSPRQQQEVEPTYDQLHDEMVNNLNQYSQTSRSQAIVQRSNGITIGQTLGAPSSRRTSNWSRFFALGQKTSQVGNLIPTGQSNYVQQEINLRSSSQLNTVKGKTKTLLPPSLFRN